MPVVDLQQVSKTIAGQKILKNISVSFKEKQITAILGHSGAGKSTLLRLLNGLEKPTSGQVKLFAQDIAAQNLIQLRRKIGYSVQGVGLFPHLTIRQNIGLLADICKKPATEIEQRIEQLLGLVGLPTDYLGRYPVQLSGGEQQRVGLCRAMMLNPPLFLLDEAFGALDGKTKAEIHSNLLAIQKVEPRTIIMVTHDVAEARRLADWALVLAKGQVTFDGPIRELSL